MTADRTHDGKMVLYAVTTGERFERWPVDGRAMVATGDYVTDPATITGTPPKLADAEREGLPALTPGAETNPSDVATATGLPAEHSPGVPLVATKSADAAPAKPVTLPKKGRGKK